MTKRPGFLTQHPLRYLLRILFFCLLSSACHPVQVPLSPTPSHTFTAIPSTSTEIVVTPSPTLVPSLPTVTASPVATALPAPLSSEGPWLVYTGQVNGDQGEIRSGQLIVNQDGTGETQITFDCNADDIRESPSNRLITFSDAFYDTIYLFDPANLTWTLVYRNWPRCHSDYTGDNEKGLLATITQRTAEEIPELLIYELPSGKIRDRFPILFKCSDEDKSCNTDNIEWGNFQLAWSPNGRYLAFAAALENQPNSDFGSSSDLYMYDSKTGKVLRLTNGLDSVAQIWWSPDGKWIIMGELHESNYPFTTSVWAVSANNNEMHKLYSVDHYPQGILGWLDDRRFIVYDGTSLYDATDLPAYNLYFVDIDASKVTPLYRGSFYTADLFTEPGMIVLGVYNAQPNQGYQGSGSFLVSISDPTTPRLLGQDFYYPDWNAELKLFVTDESCENDSTGKLAFNTKAEWQCIHSSLPDRYPAPDGKWQISIQEGTWLEGDGKQPVQIFKGNAVQVIWRPDSAGFFLLAEQNLYYVSLPEASLTLVDRYVYGPMAYQWLEK